MKKTAITVIILMLAAVLAAAVCVSCTTGPDEPSGSPTDGSRTPGPEITATTTKNPADGPTAAPTDVSNQTEAPTPSWTEEPDIKPLSGVVIYINAGHQGKGMTEKEPLAPWGPEYNGQYNNTVTKTKCTSGTEGRFTHVAEHVVTLQIALKLQALCEEQGATVVMSRTTEDVTKSNVERALEANECGADIALHIHCNGSENQNASGVEVYVRGEGKKTEAYKKLEDKDYILGLSILEEICKTTGAKKRYVSKSDNYSTINWAEMSSLIIECGFMSNEEEDNLLVTDSYQNKLAQGMLNFLIKEFGILFPA